MEKAFFTVIAFIFGLLTGSFLNVCIYRIPAGKSIVLPGSHCYRCNTFIKARDLIPVLSHFFNGGICRFCGSVISFRYSLVELLTASLFAIFFFKFGFTLYTIFCIIMVCFSIIVTFIDFDCLIIPDGISITGIFAGLFGNFILFFFMTDKVKHALSYSITPIDSLYGMLLGGGILLFISIVSGGGMGGGDIKIMAAIGAFMGMEFMFMVMILSFIYGAIIGIFLIVTRIKSRKDYIPFGPYIALAFVNVLYIGAPQINFYMRDIIWNLKDIF